MLYLHLLKLSFFTLIQLEHVGLWFDNIAIWILDNILLNYYGSTINSFNNISFMFVDIAIWPLFNHFHIGLFRYNVSMPIADDVALNDHFFILLVNLISLMFINISLLIFCYFYYIRF